jgi:RNA polymerase sigma factor for flagellar operon FliA
MEGCAKEERANGEHAGTEHGLGGRAVESYLPLVGAIARTLSRGLPSTVEMDELINDGVIGLYTALDRYDPDRGVGFSTYAGHRIRGAMLDGLRMRDPLPRALRRVQKTSEAGGIQFLELDEALMVPADESSSPEALAVEADLRRRVRCGLEALPPRDREVLELRMVRGLPLRAVAAHLSLSITRVAEIQMRGITRLRRYLNGEPLVRSRGAPAPGMAASYRTAGASLPPYAAERWQAG